MTTLLVVSDVHGYMDRLRHIQTIEAVDYTVSLGDLEGPITALGESALVIHGNAFNDPGEPYLVREFEHFRLLFTHGHLAHVERGDHGLFRMLQTHRADILMHGHTHAARLIKVEGGRIINPGALSQSRSTFPESYGILTLDDSTATWTFKNLTGQVIHTDTWKKRGSL